MILTVNQRSCIVFDLDDTLYHEYDFLCSAYREIAERCAPRKQAEVYALLIDAYHQKRKGFEELMASGMIENGVFNSVDFFLETYRNHVPKVLPFKTGVQSLLETLVSNHITLGIITDGRSITQRNKLQALGITTYFHTIVISEEIGSEKPDVRNYKTMLSEGCDNYVYIADNPKKDFIAPNALGWKTICILDEGKNIHQQQFQLPAAYLPQYSISSAGEIELQIT